MSLRYLPGTPGSLSRRAFATGLATLAAAPVVRADTIRPRLQLPPGPRLVEYGGTTIMPFFSFNTVGRRAATPTGYAADGTACWKSTNGAGEINYFLGAEQEYYQSSDGGFSPFTNRGRKLIMTASVAPPGSNPANHFYNSGMINTYTLPGGTFTGARIDVSAKLPKGNGLWPAIWLLPTNNQWPPEIDVMEMLGEDPTTIYQSLHWGPDGNDANQDKYTHVVTVPDTSAGFHTYGLDFDSTVANSPITFYFDNAVTYQTTLPPRMYGQTWYLMINLAVGGATSWGGAPTASTVFPASMAIAYLNLYTPGTVL